MGEFEHRQTYLFILYHIFYPECVYVIQILYEIKKKDFKESKGDWIMKTLLVFTALMAITTCALHLQSASFPTLLQTTHSYLPFPPHDF